MVECQSNCVLEIKLWSWSTVCIDLNYQSSSLISGLLFMDLGPLDGNAKVKVNQGFWTLLAKAKAAESLTMEWMSLLPSTCFLNQFTNATTSVVLLDYEY